MHRQIHRQRVADRRCALRLCVEHLAALVGGCRALRALRALRAINAALHARVLVKTVACLAGLIKEAIREYAFE
ncbi:hypothetical protein [Xanthomonas campestris]|uniref:hypothetical protein n=1 Tax=Xanthomonas campestris TaxID=339 RepID=UPI002B2273D5|nr:hypothetical protein [Xanthomonas campestris]